MKQLICSLIDSINFAKNRIQLTKQFCASIFWEAMPSEVFKSVSLHIANSDDVNKDTISYLIQKSRSKWDVLMVDNNFVNSKNRRNNRSRSNNDSNRKKNHHAKLSWKYHPDSSTHDTDHCILKGRKFSQKNTSNKSFNNKKCYVCNQSWTRNHRCSSKFRKNNKNKRSAKRIIPTVESEDELMSEHSSDNDLQFKAYHVQPNEQKTNNCKYIHENDFKIAPSNIMTNKFIYVPFLIEGIRTWALIDCRCSFSSVSIHLIKFLNLKTNNKTGFIKLAHDDHNVKRIGTTENKLKVLYNSNVIYSSFELFDIYDDIHVCIGMDLMPLLNITISGLAMDWDSLTGPVPPQPIDPNKYIQNNSPYGSEKEREYLQRKIQPYVDTKKRIDPRSHCNLPGSNILLPLKDGTLPTYRRQYPIAVAHEKAVDDQVQKWLRNRVIERAPPNTSYNSPLLTVNKMLKVNTKVMFVFALIVV
jgi:hypothetical protein